MITGNGFARSADIMDGGMDFFTAITATPWLTGTESGECENCCNEGIERPRCRYVDFDDDDEYCEEGIPDVNQGWVGEHYG